MEPAENFYELLEVESTASFEEVQQAYEKKLEEVHEESLASYSLCSWLILKSADPTI